ncbi:hypothetical protein BBO_01731 [Beauveria brongniartii RCEF 3172]|uniref:Uncharacterized protein n=1 Tax=Beauveria brongniartii RCEF 3172 TaxID=1081107 RepID=A0A167JD19_9HYPO|nr:hypothetical protein BBO_01731 [Beauveria brongniartii RCEF 3172]
MDITSTLSRLVTSLLPADKAALVHHHVLRADAPLQVYFSAARASALSGAGAAGGAGGVGVVARLAGERAGRGRGWGPRERLRGAGKGDLVEGV